MNILSVNPETQDNEVVAAFLLAKEEAHLVVQSYEVPIDEVHISDLFHRRPPRVIQKFNNAPMIVNLIAEEPLAVKVGMQLSTVTSERRHSYIIDELINTSSTLRAMLPTEFKPRVEFISNIIQGLIIQGEELLEASDSIKAVTIEQVGRWNVAHLPKSVDSRFTGLLMKNGAHVVTYANSEAIGMKISNEAQELGLTTADFDGFPTHWHKEKWVFVHGSRKAPRPRQLALMSRKNLRRLVRQNLERISSLEELD